MFLLFCRIFHSGIAALKMSCVPADKCMMVILKLCDPHSLSLRFEALYLNAQTINIRIVFTFWNVLNLLDKMSWVYLFYSFYSLRMKMELIGPCAVMCAPSEQDVCWTHRDKPHAL